MITTFTQLIKNRYKKLTNKVLLPIPIDQIQDALRSVGIQQGDNLLIHSSLRSFYHGAAHSNARYKTGEDYARDIIKLFLDITGDNGILMMPTEFVRGYQRASAVNEAYSLSNAPSKRGYLTDFFLKWDGVIRSTHPIYNVAVCGKGFEEVLQNHWDMLYTMDIGSPWHKFMELGGKVIFFGVPIDNNSIIHMPEYILKNDYPRPVFYNKPHVFNIEDTNGVRRQVPAYVHAITWQWGTVTKFCNYLNEKYGIYKTVFINKTPITVFTAKDQFNVLMKELENNVSWYDAIYWD